MKKKKVTYSSDQVAQRYSFLITFFVIVATVIFVRVGMLMFGAPHDYWMEVSKKFKNDNKPVPAKRGNIVAADGEILATTLPEYKMYWDFMSWEVDSTNRIKDQHMRDRMLYLKIDSASQGMHRLFPEVSAEEFRNHMMLGRKLKRNRWPIYAKAVTYVKYKEVLDLPLFNLSKPRGGGFDKEEILRRKNPFGQLAHATVGVYDEKRDTLRSGFELKFDKYLRGKPGKAHKEKVLNQYVPIIDSVAVDGCDIVTTLDVGMQDLVEKCLNEQLRAIGADVGMCVLMEVKTGDVKAITSLSHCRDGVYRERENRACTSRREPGSVFKPMSFMVAFDDGKISMNKSVYVGNGIREFHGKKMRDSNWNKGGYRRALSVPEIIKFSSNVGVSVLIDEAYRNNPQQFVEGLDRIGIRSDFEIPIQGYFAPNIRKPSEGRWSATTLPWMSVGYETQMPPIQTLAFYNGVANGGKMVRPRLVSAIKRGDEIVEEFPVKYINPDSRDNMMCSPSTLEKVKRCLEGVVGRANCTGKDVYTKRFPIAGKTGTAQIWEHGKFTGKYIISFAGYFPANDPQYSMIVCMERQGQSSGGSMCGPVFKRIAETIWARNIRAKLGEARDSTARRYDLPVMRPGNLNTTYSVVKELGLDYKCTYQRTNTLTWGTNSSNSQRMATLSSDGLNQTKKTKNPIMPNVEGYGLRDALYRLELMGLKVKTSGSGRVVQQSISPKTPVKRGQEVELVLSTAIRTKDDDPYGPGGMLRQNSQNLATKPTPTTIVEADSNSD